MTNLIKRMTFVQKPQDLLNIDQTMGESLYGTRIILSLPEYKDSFYYPILFPKDFSKDYIVPYFCYPFVYFIHHERIRPYGINIDYTLSFDTNAASYVKKIVLDNSLKTLNNKIANAFDNLLTNNMNFDCIFYFFENYKLVYPILAQLKNKRNCSPISFWKLLNKDFRWNIVCLTLFMGVDCSHYKKNKELRYDFSFLGAVRNSVNFTYNFYVSSEGQFFSEDIFFRIQKDILFQLLAIYRIQFASKKSPAFKLGKFLDFLQDNGEVYLERETIMAHKYFTNRKSMPILNKINQGCNIKGLLKKIDNIAWDITTSRFMEKMFTVTQQGDYMIPFFLSFDKRLRYLLSSFPIKAVIYDHITGMVHSIPAINTYEYFKSEGCQDIMDNFFSLERKTLRFSNRKSDSKSKLFRIRHEYKKLRLSLQQS